MRFLKGNPDESDSLVLVLASSMPVGWRLAFVGAHGGFRDVSVVLSGGSVVSSSNVAPSNVLRVDKAFGLSGDDYTDAALLGAVRQKWGAVTSFARTQGANRISILLSDGKFCYCIAVSSGKTSSKNP